MSKGKDSLHYTYVPRKVYDRAMDRLKELNGRRKEEFQKYKKQVDQRIALLQEEMRALLADHEDRYHRPSRIRIES